MADGPEPLVGIIWYEAVDPTVSPGIQAPIWQLLVRTDTSPNELYWHSGASPTAWTLIGGGGGGGPSVDVENQGSAIPNNPHATLNFTGPDVTASDAGGGVADIAIGASTITTVTVANTPYTILSTDDYLYVDTSGGAITMILPNPTTFTFAKTYYIVDSTGSFNTNNLTLSPHGAELLEGLNANKVFSTQWGGWTVATDGVKLVRLLSPTCRSSREPSSPPAATGPVRLGSPRSDSEWSRWRRRRWWWRWWWWRIDWSRRARRRGRRQRRIMWQRPQECCGRARHDLRSDHWHGRHGWRERWPAPWRTLPVHPAGSVGSAQEPTGPRPRSVRSLRSRVGVEAREAGRLAHGKRRQPCGWHELGDRHVGHASPILDSLGFSNGGNPNVAGSGWARPRRVSSTPLDGRRGWRRWRGRRGASGGGGGGGLLSAALARRTRTDPSGASGNGGNGGAAGAVGRNGGGNGG